MSENNFGIIDTFLINAQGIYLGEIHFQRTLKALSTFCPESVNETHLHDIYAQIKASPIKLKGRLVFPVSDWLNFKFESFPLDVIKEPQQLRISPLATQTSGCGALQNLKTTVRTYWDQSLILKGSADDIIGMNDQGYITETSRFNLFLKKENQYVTPPLESGCLAGVYREFLLSQKSGLQVTEQQLTPADLTTGELHIGNSVRGLIRATVV